MKCVSPASVLSPHYITKWPWFSCLQNISTEERKMWLCVIKTIGTPYPTNSHSETFDKKIETVSRISLHAVGALPVIPSWLIHDRSSAAALFPLT